MSWLLLALGSALGMATADYFTKRGLADLPLRQVTLVRVVGLVPVALAILLFSPWPEVQPRFFLAVAVAMPAEIAAMFIYLRAIQISTLGQAQPFFAATGLFAVLSAYLILGEQPTWLGAAGVLLLALGSYAVNLDQLRDGWLAPIRAAGRDRGSMLMLAAAAMYAFIAVVGKVAVQASSPLFMAGAYPLIFALCLLVVLRARGPIGRQWLGRPWSVAGVAVSMMFMLVCHFQAISMAPAAYMLAIKRTSTLMAVAYGGLLLGEARLLQHLAACLLMVAGGALITIFG